MTLSLRNTDWAQTRCMVTRTLATIVILLAVSMSMGCGGSDQPSVSKDGGTETPREDANSGPNLFSDPTVPECGPGAAPQYQLRGTIAGDPSMVVGTTGSYFTKPSLEILSVVNGEVQTDCLLTWNDSLQFDRSVTLTGGSLLVPPEHSLAGRTLCVTSGSLGVRRASGGAGIEVLFAITGARADSCTGPVTAIDLKGCLYRIEDTLP